MNGSYRFRLPKSGQAETLSIPAIPLPPEVHADYGFGKPANARDILESAQRHGTSLAVQIVERPLTS